MGYWNNTAREDYPGDDAPTGERHWLAESDYDYCPENEIWTKDMAPRHGIVARKAHKGLRREGRGYIPTTINPGDRYTRRVMFEIDDRTGSRTVITKKYLSRRAAA